MRAHILSKVVAFTLSGRTLSAGNYDASGRVESQDAQLARRTSLDYQAVPGATVVTSPAGRKTVYRYSDGLLTVITSKVRACADPGWFQHHPDGCRGRCMWSRDSWHCGSGASCLRTAHSRCPWLWRSRQEGTALARWV